MMLDKRQEFRDSFLDNPYPASQWGVIRRGLSLTILERGFEQPNLVSRLEFFMGKDAI